MDISRPRNTFAAGWHQLTLLKADLSGPARRRANVLAGFTLLLIVAILLFAVLTVLNAPRELLSVYGLLYAALLALFVAAFELNREGHYHAAAYVVVGVTTFGT